MAATAREQASDGGKGSSQGAGNWSSGLGSNLGWAISSFGLSRNETAAGGLSNGGSASSSGLPAGSSGVPAGRPASAAGGGAGPPPAMLPSHVPQQKDWQANSQDGWQDDGSSDEDPHEAPAAAPSAARPSAATQGKPVQVRHVALSSPGDSWDEMDRFGLGDGPPSKPALRLPRAPSAVRSGRAGGRKPLGAARGAGGRGAMKLGANKLSQPKQEPDFSEW